MIYDDFLDEDALKLYLSSLNGRAKQANLAPNLSLEMLRDRILESGAICAWCGISLYRQAFEIDHIIPLSSGGKHEADNLAMACPDCNRHKSAKHPARFAQEIYARTGNLNPLLRRVFTHYEIEPRSQKSLFETPNEAEADWQFPSEDNSDEPPPYRWK